MGTAGTPGGSPPPAHGPPTPPPALLQGEEVQRRAPCAALTQLRGPALRFLRGSFLPRRRETAGQGRVRCFRAAPPSLCALVSPRATGGRAGCTLTRPSPCCPRLGVLLRGCAKLCGLGHGAVWLCTVVHPCAWLPINVHPCAWLCVAVHPAPWLCLVAWPSLCLCKAVWPCAWWCVVVHPSLCCPRSCVLCGCAKL